MALGLTLGWRTDMLKNLLIFLLSFMCISCERDEPRRSLVMIYSSQQPFGVVSPWERTSLEVKKYYGVFVRKNIILTSADALRHERDLQMSFLWSSEKFSLSKMRCLYPSL